MPKDNTTMTIAHITLATRNVAQTCDFFARTLGWQPINRPGNITAKAAWLEIAPGQELHLLEIEAYEPTAFEREYGRHIALEIPLAEFDSLKKRLVDASAEIIAPERATPFERFFFRGPDGYVFEVVDSGRPSKT